jgi:hypothetical protein
MVKVFGKDELAVLTSAFFPDEDDQVDEQYYQITVIPPSAGANL